MIRVTGDLPGLLDLAESTGSLPELRERLAYLNAYGDGHGIYINVDVIIVTVDIENHDAEVCVKFYLDKNNKPEKYPMIPTATTIGGLNLYKKSCQPAGEEWAWSVNT